jgi:hypothetical protein
MKKIYLLLLFVFGFSAFAQQKGITYQAVIINPKAITAPGYNGTSIPLANKAICLSFQIVNGTNQVEYQESQSITTDTYGMINVVIGSGTPGSGLVASLEAVNWNQGNKKLVVGVNTDGVCSNYTEISNQVLNYTPYSFYAQNADIKDGYVTTAKLADGAVTDPKVAMGINPTKVGLGNVNNTSDANKPISTATQAALNLKANLDSPTFTGTVSGIDKTMVGLSNVDNTTDAAKPISTATQTALDLKANTTDVTTSLDLKENLSNKSSDIITDATSTTKYPTVKAIKEYVDTQNAAAGVADGTITSAKIANATIVNADVAPTAAIDFSKLNIQKADVVGLGLNKSDIGLSNVNNTTDAAKPVSTATQTALDLKANLASPTFTGTVSGIDKTMVGLSNVNNTTDAAKPVSTATQTALDLKANLASPTFTGTVSGIDKTMVGLSNVNNTTDAAKPISTATQTALDLKANTADVTAALVLKEDTSNKSTAIGLGNSNQFYPTQNAVKTYVDTQIASATIVDASAVTKGKIQLTGDLGGTADVPTVPGLVLKAPIASPSFTGTVTAPTYASTPIVLSYTGATINWNPAEGLNAAITLTQNSTLGFTAAPPVGSYGTIVLTQDGTGSRTITLPTISGVTNQILGSTSTTAVALSTAANAKDILNFYYDGTNCYWNIGQGYGTAATTNVGSNVSGILPVANGGTGAATLTGLLKGNGTTPLTAAVAGTDYQVPILLTTSGSGAATLTGNTLNIPSTTNYSLPTSSASILGGVKVGTNLSIDGDGVLSTSAAPTFAGTVTSPIYASTPQTLTAGATITWNPANGLNASVTLDQNSILSFTTTPTAGSYGTLVVSQDATGGRSITLPSTANKVLGSTSTTTIALSSAANAKDILNFYYDGTNCYWNIGQGYGTAATVTSTNLASSVSGTLPVGNGGTGATTLTGLLKGNGSTAITAAVAV